MPNDFKHLNIDDLKGEKIFLDIDGTITSDGDEEIEGDVELKIRQLISTNSVWFCSNGSENRTKKIAEKFNVRFLSNQAKKPSIKALANEDISIGDKLTVIGDKFLTDGLFSVGIGARFIQVDSIRKKPENAFTKISYFVDKIAGKILRPFFDRLDFLFLLRPKQWIKNILIFAPLFFAGSLFVKASFINTFMAFVVFCAVSSMMYIANDIYDRKQDSLHPIKKFRPIARESISVKQGKIVFIALAVIALIIVNYLPDIFPTLLIYIGLNILYSKYLKHIAIIDVVMVALFYVLRIEIGGLAAEVAVSPWIILCVFFGALFVVSGKRRAECEYESKRAVMDKYADGMIDNIVSTAAILSIATYSLYSVLGAKSSYEVYTVPIVAAAILRVMNMMKFSPKVAEFPESFIFKDKVVVYLFLFWILFALILIY